MRARQVAVLLLITCVAFQEGTALAAQIRIAFSSISGAMLPLWVTQEKGLFKRHGLDVDLTYIRGVSLEAMLAGEVQFIRASPPGVIRAALSRKDLRYQLDPGSRRIQMTSPTKWGERSVELAQLFDRLLMRKGE